MPLPPVSPISSSAVSPLSSATKTLANGQNRKNLWPSLAPDIQTPLVSRSSQDEGAHDIVHLRFGVGKLFIMRKQPQGEQFPVEEAFDYSNLLEALAIRFGEDTAALDYIFKAIIGLVTTNQSLAGSIDKQINGAFFTYPSLRGHLILTWGKMMTRALIAISNSISRDWRDIRFRHDVGAFALGALHHKCKVGELGSQLMRVNALAPFLVPCENKVAQDNFPLEKVDEFSHIHHHPNMWNDVFGDAYLAEFLDQVNLSDNYSTLDLYEMAVCAAFTLTRPKLPLALEFIEIIVGKLSGNPESFDDSYRNSYLLIALSDDKTKVQELEKKTLAHLVKKHGADKEEKLLKGIQDFSALIRALYEDLETGRFDVNAFVEKFTEAEFRLKWKEALLFHPCGFFADLLAPRFREESQQLRLYALKDGMKSEAEALFDFSDDAIFKLPMPDGFNTIKDIVPFWLWEEIKRSGLKHLIYKPMTTWGPIKDWYQRSLSNAVS